MRVEVVTVFASRPADSHSADYYPLLRLQRDSAHHFGHDHLIVTDDAMYSEFEQYRTWLPKALMPAMIAGLIARLEQPVQGHLLLADSDCLIVRNLEPAFEGDFDLGLTPRANPVSPINNGAMYVPFGGAARAADFFRIALDTCGDYWAADQEAISQAAAPITEVGDTIVRHGCRIKLLPIGRFAAVPKAPLRRHTSKNPYVVHFKGMTKVWMEGYAHNFVFNLNPIHDVELSKAADMCRKGLTPESVMAHLTAPGYEGIRPQFTLDDLRAASRGIR